jgi:hypothetical protein
VLEEWTPIFVLYEDGLVIYNRDKYGSRGEEMSANLGRAGALALAREIAEMGFFELPLHERVSSATDQPTVSILLRDGTRWHFASVYGIGRDGNTLHSGLLGGDDPSRAFRRAYRRLVTFGAPRASPWKPDQIDVMLWKRENAHTSVPWPAAIPRPATPVMLPDGGVAIHVRHQLLDGSYEDAARAFEASLRQGTTAVELDGASWSFSYQRCLPEGDYIGKVMQAIHAQR